MKTYATFLFLLFVQFTYAQQQTKWWYFGRNAGVCFDGDSVKAVANGGLSTEEGCVVISNSMGDLLFYSDGITVWNSKHEVMMNGAGLKGDPSSTQSGIAVQRPMNPSQYYLFSVAATAGASGLTYSLVDMTKDGGKGSVIQEQKNVQLAAPVTEKLTSVLHRNGKHFWVLVHGWKNNEFLAYLVTENGVSAQPVVSKVGSIHEPDAATPTSLLNTQGYMKANPDGTNIALALEETNIIEMFDFDSETGVVSRPISVKMPAKSYVYGVEFSADGSLLYATAAGTGELYQYNLQAGSDSLIQKSLMRVGKTPNGEWLGALQLASDGKIYFPIYQTSYLGVIEHPNVLGQGCEFKLNAVELLGKKCALGLPSFIQSYFVEKVNKQVTYFDPTKVKKGQKLVLKNVYFDFNKSTLQSKSFVELDKVVAVMKAHPEYKIGLYGHTDNIGNKSYNIQLSDDRAAAVKKYLVSKGIKADRIDTKGFGSSQPVSSNDTDAGRAKNRRVEFMVL